MRILQNLPIKEPLFDTNWISAFKVFFFFLVSDTREHRLGMSYPKIALIAKRVGESKWCQVLLVGL